MAIENSLYLDHQATTPVAPEVMAAMRPYLENDFGNPHSSEHAMGWRAAQAIETAAKQLAALIGADSNEIIFTSGATEANNLALLGLARGNKDATRRRVLLGATEHKCVLRVGRVLEEQLDYIVETVPVDEEGTVSYAKMEDRLGDDVLIISIMAVNNEIGTIQNIEAISQVAAKCGAFFHTDAAQAPCAMDMTRLARNVDLLSLSGHKMYGPKGIGALYIKRELQPQIEPLIYGGGQQNGLRSGTLPTALCIGLGAAAELVHAWNCEGEQTRIAHLRDQFIEGMRKVATVQLNGPECGPKRHPGNANIEFVGRCAQDILWALQPKLAASTGSACSSGTPEPSHVLRAIGLSPSSADASIRFSLGHDTTKTDVTNAITLINETLKAG